METTTQIIRPEPLSTVLVEYRTSDGRTTRIVGTVVELDEDSVLLSKSAEFDDEEPVEIDDGELWSLFDIEQADPDLSVKVIDDVPLNDPSLPQVWA